MGKTDRHDDGTNAQYFLQLAKFSSVGGYFWARIFPRYPPTEVWAKWGAAAGTFFETIEQFRRIRVIVVRHHFCDGETDFEDAGWNFLICCQPLDFARRGCCFISRWILIEGGLLLRRPDAASKGPLSYRAPPCSLC